MRLWCWFGWHTWDVQDITGRIGGIYLLVRFLCRYCGQSKEYSIHREIDTGTFVKTYRNIKR